MDGKPKLLDRLREQIRIRHYSIRTETAYIKWVQDFIRYHKLCHPAEMGAPEVEQFLSHLAVDLNVSASTQNQALAALLFLYKQVLAIELPWLNEVVRAKRPERLPVALSIEEVWRVLGGLDGELWLACSLLYGTGMRLMEVVRLRVAVSLHASSPRSVTLAQLRFTSFAVASSQGDLHLQECAHAGRA